MPERVRRYEVAVIGSAVAIIVVMALSAILPFKPLLLFAIPVVLTSRYAGRGPTVAVVALVILGTVSLFVLSGQFRLTHPQIWMHTAVFIIVAIVIDSTSAALNRALREAEQSASHLEDLNIELEQQMDHIQRLSDDLQTTNRCLAQARDTAEDASRAREEMLAVVAHDLRNPLNLMMMTTQLLADADVSRERREHLFSVIYRASHRMNRLIEDLLEIVRQESGQMTLNIEDVPAASIISQTAEMFQSAAMERGISLRATDASPDLAVRSDQGRIIQVMSNLVGNALKFVPSGGTVVLDAKREDGEVVFSVNDSGPGIPPEDLHRLFERFWQRRRDDKRGVGLGLTIARGIVEAHGGRIWAESQLGHGATFYFTLPSAAERSARPAIATQSVPEINSRPLPAAPALQITA